MAYSDFSLESVEEKLGVTAEPATGRFAGPPLEPSELLRAILADTEPVATTTDTEKGRSEGLVAPILMEVRRRAGFAVGLHSGRTFDVEWAAGLVGRCDFLLSRAPQNFVIRAPVVAVAEAKNADTVAGLGQAAAGMVAAWRFNKRSGKPLASVFGVSTSGTNWRFLELTGEDGTRLILDQREYYLYELPLILGILVRMVRGD